MKILLTAVGLAAATAAAAQGGPVVNESTGDLTYTYAFKLPKARGRYQAELALVYSSAQNQDAGYGHGWTLGATYIERDTRGSPDKPTRWLVEGRNRKLLVALGQGYRPEVEESFFEVTPDSSTGGSTYTALDANGTIFTFGRVFGTRAYLSSVADLDGNITVFAYDADKEDVVEIRYNNYGSTASPSFAAKVRLEYTSDRALAPAAVAGLVVDRQWRLSRVRILGPTGDAAAPERTIRGYEVRYTPPGAALTTSIERLTEYGGDFAAYLPSTVFSYHFGDWGYDVPVTVTAPLSTLPAYYALNRGGLEGGQWMDLDGDGRADLVWTRGDFSEIYWARNTTPIGGGTPEFQAPVRVALPGVELGSFARLQDYDGDGTVDLIKAWKNGSQVFHNIYRGHFDGQSLTFAPAAIQIDLNGVFYVNSSAEPVIESEFQRLVDLNGDGVPDYARRTATSPCTTTSRCQWTYWLTILDPAGTGRVQYGGTLDVVPGGPWFDATTGWEPKFLAVDMNGDGLVDAVWNDWRADLDVSTGFWKVGANDGLAFQTGVLARFLWGDDPDLAGYADSPRLEVDTRAFAGCPDSTKITDTRYTYGDLVDLNGDGRPDLFTLGRTFWNSGREWVLDEWSIIHDLALGWVSPPSGGGPYYARYDHEAQWEYQWNCSTPYQYRTCDCAGSIDSPYQGGFVDLNGDGIPDFINTLSGTPPTDLSYFHGVSSAGVARPIVLYQIQTSEGATYQIEYANSSLFGALAKSRRPVVTTVTVAGVPGAKVPANTTYYWYENPVGTQAWYDPIKFDDRGFSTTWTQDETTRVVRWTTWVTNSHALVGKPAASATGVPDGNALGLAASATNPGSHPAVSGGGWFARQTFGYGAKQLTAGPGASCLSAGEPAAQAYPLRVITTQTVNSTYHPLSGSGSTVESSVTTDVICGDVDVDGNVLKSTTTPALGGVTGKTLTTQWSFTGSTACKNVPIQLRVTRSDAQNKLAEEFSLHDTQSCKLLQRYSPGSSTTATNVVTYTYNGPFRLMDSTRVGLAVTKRFVYDPSYSLYVIQETTEDGLTTLATTHTYDFATGYRLSSTGPKVLQPASASNAITRYYLYDAFGRTLAVAKQDFATSATAAPPGLVPPATQVNAAVEAYQYLDQERPRKVVSYRYSVEKTYSTANAIPAENASKAVTYYDGLGRTIQQRESLSGGGGVALTGSRVSKAVIFDGAGRVRASLEPFYADGEGFVDYAAGGIPATRGTVTSYDQRGRPWCVAYQYISGAAPAAADCGASDSSNSSTFRLATKTSYTARTISQRGPYGGSFVATEVIPPDVNAVGGTAPRVTLLGPAGEELGAIDGDGNYTWVERDAMGREIASWREGANRALSTPQPASTIGYNLAGQVVTNWDANSTKVARQSRYDEAGRLTFVTTDPATREGIEYVYRPGDLGRLTEIWEVTYPVAGGAASDRLVVRNHYDVPFNADDAGYSYLAGKLAWTENEETRIAYGYDDAARVWRRDQWFMRLDASKRITVSSTYGADGRVIDSKVVNSFDPNAQYHYQYNVDYDSAGRPVALSGNLWNQATSRVYEAVSQGAQGAYDALGRIPTMKADNGLVVSARRYGEYSGALLGECKRLDASVVCAGSALDAAKDIYRSDPVEASYQGGKLSSYTDSGTGTRYTNQYLPSGRLQSTEARPLGEVRPLTQDWLEGFGFNGIGNLEAVAAQRNTLAASTPRPRRYETQWYAPESVATGQVLDRVAATVKKVSETPGGAPVTGAEAGQAASTSLSYDLSGHLTRVTRSAGERESLWYGPGAELVGRQVGERFVFYVGEYATVTASGLPGCGSTCVPQAATVEVDAHVVFAGTRIASAKPSRTLYYYRTRLGTVVATSLGGGVPGAGYRYTAYGEVELSVNETDATRSELGYTNALRLTGSLLYLKNRVYDAEARVFVQPDTVDRLRYAYVTGDPVNLSDPTGLEPRQDAPVVQVFKDGTEVRIAVTDSNGNLKVVASWNTEIPVSAESAKQMAHQIGLVLDALKLAIGERMPGTRAAEYSLKFFIKAINDPGSSRGERTLAYVGGFFAALWTRETAVSTTVALATAAAGGAAAVAANAADSAAGQARQPTCAGPCGADQPALPDSYWQNRKVPDQVEPGTRRVTDMKPSSRSQGEVYERTTYYDEFGRSLGQTHRTSHGDDPSVHPNPHHHIRDSMTGERSGPIPGVHPEDNKP